MRVDVVDPVALEALQALLGSLIVGQVRPDLGVVKRHGRQEEARAVQVEVPPVDPELAESEPFR